MVERGGGVVEVGMLGMVVEVEVEVEAEVPQGYLVL